MPVITGIYDTLIYRKDQALLSLPGNAIRDWSWWRNTLSSTSIAIETQTNSYTYTTTSSGILTAVNPSLFGFGANDFTLKCEVLINAFRASGKATLIGNDSNSPASSNYAWRVTNAQTVEFYYYNQSNVLTTFTHSLPDTNYLSDFQAFKVVRTGSFLNFYYKNNLLATSSMGTDSIITKPGTGRIYVGFSGSNSTFGLQGKIRKVRVLCPANGTPPGY